MASIRCIIAFALLLCGCGNGGGEAEPALSPPVGPDGTVRIHDIQGSGEVSPLAGEVVTVTGIVSADLQNDDGDELNSIGGFFLQSETPDTDPRTSEGVFVFDRNLVLADISVGDRVEVVGNVTEHFGETQLVADSVRIVGNGAVRVTDLALPSARVAFNSDGEPIADLEHYEGMRVRVPADLYVQDLYGLERYGEVLLATAQRQSQFTNVEAPDATAFAAWQQRLAAERLMLDDGGLEQNRSPIRYLSAQRPTRAGDRVTAINGVLRYSRGSAANGMETWRLLPVEAPHFESLNPREAPPVVGGNVVVASFNLLNYFSTIDTGSDRCGPDASDSCRGADSVQEFSRQRDKIVQTLLQLDADIVGVMELENDGAISTLVDALNARSGGSVWSFIDTGTIGSDVIRVGLLYKADRVSASGPFAILDQGVDPNFNDDRNRPVLAQTFRLLANGGLFTVSVSHLKSKGSPCDDINDPDRGDGQANCNRTRVAAAQSLAAWLASDPTGSGDPDHLIIGDLNAYLREDPVRALETAGFNNLLRRNAGDAAYTFVYRGQSGALDHALASVTLEPQVQRAAVWHINADEAPVMDYNLEFGRDAGLFDASVPWRASDHDPVVVGLRLEAGQ